MKKSFNLIFAVLTVPVDFILIILAGITSYKLRFQEFITDIRPAVYNYPFADFVGLMILLSIFIIFIFAISGVYKINKRVRFFEEIIKLFNTTSFAIMFVIVFIFFKREYFNSRFIILVGAILIVLYLVIGRVVLRKIKHLLYKHGVGARNIILVGLGSNFSVLRDAINFNYKMGYRIIDTVASFEEFNVFYKRYDGEIDEIIQTNVGKNDDNKEFLNFCEQNHIIFKYVADLFDARTSNLDIDTIAGVPVVEIKKTKLDGWGRVIKRVFDIFTSSIAIILSSPIMLVTAICIKMDSKGPVIYKNKRVGKSGKEFDTLKFRSMYYEMSTGVGNPDQDKKALELEKQLIEKNNTREGAIYKIKDDPRITKVGHIIRKYSIDEFPQFFNVFIGNMSLVGPRPHQAREVSNYRKDQLRVLDIKPGITGIAQVSGRSDLNTDDEIKLDIYYIDNWSFIKDLLIIFKTPFAVFGKRKVE